MPPGKLSNNGFIRPQNVSVIALPNQRNYTLLLFLMFFFVSCEWVLLPFTSTAVFYDWIYLFMLQFSNFNIHFLSFALCICTRRSHVRIKFIYRSIFFLLSLSQQTKQCVCQIWCSTSMACLPHKHTHIHKTSFIQSEMIPFLLFHIEICNQTIHHFPRILFVAKHQNPLQMYLFIRSINHSFTYNNNICSSNEILCNVIIVKYQKSIDIWDTFCIFFV